MFKESRMVFKSPFHTQEMQMLVSANDPETEGGITYNGTNFRMNVDGTVYSIPTSASAGANPALSNLVSVAINDSLISDTDSTDDLGSSSVYWANTYSDKIYLNATATLDGSLAGSVAVTGTLAAAGALTVALGSTLTGNVTCGAGITSSAATGAGIGYATGAGAAVTQITNRSTGVTSNTLSGTIQTDTTSLAAGASAEFTFTNSTIAIGDVVVVSQQSGSDLIAGTSGVTHIEVVTVAAGSCEISVDNNSSTTAEEGAIIINYAVIKAVAA